LSLVVVVVVVIKNANLAANVTLQVATTTTMVKITATTTYIRQEKRSYRLKINKAAYIINHYKINYELDEDENCH